MPRLATTTRRPCLAKLAAAVAAALLCPLSAGAALALDYYQYSGAVSTWPVNLFPVSTTSATLDLGRNTLGVGNGATGSFSALAGAWLQAGQLAVANGGPGFVGSFNASSGAQVDLGGSLNRLEVGNWGIGSATISGGARLDATVNAGACNAVGAWCNNFIGNAAGSNATLTVTGAGSEVKLLRYLGVGSVAVFTQAVDGFNFGTPGGTTRAEVNVLAGGTLRSENTSIGNGPSNTAALGTERSFADVVIDGTGSQWIVSRNTVSNTAASINFATHANATATMQIRNGGKLRVDGSGSAGPYDGIGIGTAGTATVTVSGANSTLEIGSSLNPYINLGASSATGRGTLNVLSGGTVRSLYMNVGRRGGDGTLLVDGAGSQLLLTGVGVAVAGTDAFGTPAFVSIGRDGGTGRATVSGGGRLLISDDGGDDRAGNGSPGLALGRGIGGNGSLTITGPGSTVEIVARTLGLAAGQPDNFNPFVAVGYDNPGTSTGTLRVENGGKLILTGNAVSTVANSRTTSLNIGGRNGTAGNGSAIVTGAGSEIRMQGNDTYIGVGRTAGSTGRLDVLDQAQVSSISMVVGVNATGTLNIDNASIVLAGHRTNTDPAVGAGVNIGRGVGGVGVLTMRNAATLTITPTLLTSGMSVGGDQFASGGSGTVTLSGGSSIVFGGTLSGNGFSVGRSGIGSVVLTGTSFIDVGLLGTADFGRELGGIGNLSLASGSSLRANEVAIGGRSDTVAGGSATASVSGAGSVLRAQGASGFISVGRGGAGDLQVSNQASVAGIVLNVGRAAGGVGTMTVDNASIAMSGQQTSGNAVGAAVSIGNRSGNGTLDLVNNSQLTISNPGNEGVRLNIGGTSLNPGGTGQLNVIGSTITMSAPGGLSRATIGRDGSGAASFSAGSRLDNAGGEVIIAAEPGSVGQLTLASGSVLNASYVGVGSKPGGIDGGIGSLIVNDSTVNTTTLEIGSLSKLGGSSGVINGFIINRGTISPGNSPGRLIVNGGIEMTDGARLVLDVEADGAGGFRIDELVLTRGTTYDFAAVAVTFNFLGSTDPEAFASSGAMALDSFLRVRDAGVDSPLSSSFAPGTSYQGLFSQASFGATSPTYAISNLNLTNDGSGSFGSFTATPVPEPAAWLMMALGLVAVGTVARRRPVRSAA